VSHVLHVPSKKSLPNLRLRRFSKFCIFSSCLHFGLSFMYHVNKVLRLIFWHVNSKCSSNICEKDYPFPIKLHSCKHNFYNLCHYLSNSPVMVKYCSNRSAKDWQNMEFIFTACTLRKSHKQEYCLESVLKVSLCLKFTMEFAHWSFAFHGGKQRRLLFLYVHFNLSSSYFWKGIISF
jgi:hypothetical protein